MTLEFRIVDTELRIALPPELPDTFLDELIEGYTEHEKHSVIDFLLLDFAQIRDLSSTGIGALATIALSPEFKGKHIKFLNVSRHVRSLLELIGINKLFTINPVIDEPEGKRQSLHEIRKENLEKLMEEGFNDAMPAEERPEQKQARQKVVDLITEASKLREELAEKNKIIENWGIQIKKNLESKTKELHDLRQQLIHSERLISIGQLSAGVAHEFNNILAGMRGYAQLAQMRKDPATIDQALQVVLDLSDRAQKITEGLLSFSRKKNPNKESADVHDIINKVLSLVKQQCKVNNIKIKPDFAEMPELPIDTGQMEQVFLNLITNAIHAMTHGGTLTLRSYVEDKFGVIEVSDTGEGISPNHIAKIFDPFFTTKGPLGGGETEGTGLGLSVSQGIILNHRGTVHVTSSPGEGTTFTIRLPLKFGSRTAIPESAAPEPADKKAISNLDILVVDDEKPIRDILHQYLTAMGHHVRTAEDGYEAINLAKEQAPDLVFLDILMPGINGADVFLDMKMSNQEIKVVVVTGHAGKSLDTMLDSMRRVGTVDVIRKPFSLDQINDSIGRSMSGQVSHAEDDGDIS